MQPHKFSFSTSCPVCVSWCWSQLKPLWIGSWMLWSRASYSSPASPQEGGGFVGHQLAAFPWVMSKILGFYSKTTAHEEVAVGCFWRWRAERGRVPFAGCWVVSTVILHACTSCLGPLGETNVCEGGQLGLGQVWWMGQCCVLPSQQATYALLALAWVFVPVYISSGVCGSTPIPGASPEPCAGNAAASQGRWRGDRMGKPPLLSPPADRHHAWVPAKKVWRREDPDVPLWAVTPAVHLHQNLCKYALLGSGAAPWCASLWRGCGWEALRLCCALGFYPRSCGSEESCGGLLHNLASASAWRQRVAAAAAVSPRSGAHCPLLRDAQRSPTVIAPLLLRIAACAEPERSGGGRDFPRAALSLAEVPSPSRPQPSVPLCPDGAAGTRPALPAAPTGTGGSICPVHKLGQWYPLFPGCPNAWELVNTHFSSLFPWRPGREVVRYLSWWSE